MLPTQGRLPLSSLLSFWTPRVGLIVGCEGFPQTPPSSNVRFGSSLKNIMCHVFINKIASKGSIALFLNPTRPSWLPSWKVVLALTATVLLGGLTAHAADPGRTSLVPLFPTWTTQGWINYSKAAVKRSLLAISQA